MATCLLRHLVYCGAAVDEEFALRLPQPTVVGKIKLAAAPQFEPSYPIPKQIRENAVLLGILPDPLLSRRRRRKIN